MWSVKQDGLSPIRDRGVMNNSHDKAGDSKDIPNFELVEQIDLMIRARYPLLYMVAVEEEPLEEVLFKVAALSQPPRQVLYWDIVRGWSDNGADKGSVMAPLARIGKTDAQKSVIFVLRDLHPYVKNLTTERSAPIVRELRNLARELKRSRKSIILTSHTLEVPEELKEEATVVDFPLPDVPQINYLVETVGGTGKAEISRFSARAVGKSLSGIESNPDSASFGESFGSETAG